MSKKRVVVTGFGLVSCFGNDADKYYDDLLAGKSGVSLLEGFSCEGFPTRIGGEIKNFDTEGYVDRKQARRLDSVIQYSMVAGKKAMEKAGLSIEGTQKLDKKRCGILIGSGMGGMKTFESGMKTFESGIYHYLEHGLKKLSPFFIPSIITNMSGGALAIDYGFMGPNYSISTACATSNNCILAAANHIKYGDADLMITGGAESPISAVGVGGFVACRAVSQRNDEPQKASRPWDKDRDGFVIGEGAGVLVLESLEHAQKRGAPIYAEFLGGGLSCDAFHMTAPPADGSTVSLCIENALRNSGVAKEDVSYINAHATSTPVGDAVELRGLHNVFGNLKNIKINGTKSLIGHGLGAAGGLEAIAVVKAILTNKLHPTLNVDNPIDEVEKYNMEIFGKAIDHEVRVAMSTSLGFGGHNATILFAPFKE